MRASSTRIEFDLVDDGEGVAALNHLRHVVLHVVAQVVEAELVVGAVGDVGGVGRPALLVVEPVHDHADGQAKELVDLAHPLGVAAGEVVVDRDHMHAFAGERIEVDRAGGDQRLAFAGAHLGDRAFVQDKAADELDVEMALFQRPLGRFAHGGEGGRGEVVERLAGGEFRAKLDGLCPQLIVGQRLELGLERVDGRNLGLVALQASVVGRAEHPFHHRVELEGGEHFRPFHAGRRISRAAPIHQASRGAAHDNGHNKKRETRQNARFRAAEQGCRSR